MNAKQSDTLFKYYESLSISTKQALWTREREEATKARIALEEKNTNQNCNKDDLARLAELRAFPGANSLWMAALNPMDRQSLDATKSHASAERDGGLNAWNGLALIFNNYG
jgi:hypothetical protein